MATNHCQRHENTRSRFDRPIPWSRVQTAGACPKDGHNHSRPDDTTRRASSSRLQRGKAPLANSKQNGGCGSGSAMERRGYPMPLPILVGSYHRFRTRCRLSLLPTCTDRVHRFPFLLYMKPGQSFLIRSICWRDKIWVGWCWVRRIVRTERSDDWCGIVCCKFEGRCDTVVGARRTWVVSPFDSLISCLFFYLQKKCCHFSYEKDIGLQRFTKGTNQPNIIKKYIEILDHRTAATIVRTSRWRAAPLPKSARPCR